MRKISFLLRAMLALAVIPVPQSHAHITLETKRAEAASYYKAVFKVGHGCEGSDIREIIVHIPPGVVGVKPMPKAGWQVVVEKTRLPVPYVSHGRTIEEAPSAIRWQGGVLPDAHYDEFVLISRLPETPGMLYWKVSQVCEKGRIDWAQIPEAGKRLSDYPEPAASLEILPKPQNSSGQ